MIMMIMMNIFMSITFIFLNHPLSLGCVLLVQTILISIMSGLMYLNFFYSYILFLIMVGGMLVMFMYMTSVASNEKFKMPKKMLIFTLIFIMLYLNTIIFMDKFMDIIMTMSNMSNKFIFYNLNFSMNKLYNFPNMKFMAFLILYLLLTLIAIVKIIGKNPGTLRKK